MFFREHIQGERLPKDDLNGKYLLKLAINYNKCFISLDTDHPADFNLLLLLRISGVTPEIPCFKKSSFQSMHYFSTIHSGKSSLGVVKWIQKMKRLCFTYSSKTMSQKAVIRSHDYCKNFPKGTFNKAFKKGKVQLSRLLNISSFVSPVYTEEYIISGIF